VGETTGEQRDKGIMAQHVVPSVEAGVNGMSTRVLMGVNVGMVSR
jgi:hypothetical protein